MSSTQVHKFIFPLSPANMVLGVLVALTAGTFLIAEQGLGGLSIVGLLLAGVLMKGHLIVDVFMGLGRVKRHWRWLMGCYLSLLIGLIYFAYWLSISN